MKENKMHKAKGYNYHKLARQTGFIKKPSAKQIRKMVRDSHKINVELEMKKYDTHTRENMKFGIFNVKGYRPLELFATREEAEKCLAENFRKPEYYEIREIIDFGV